MLRPGCGLAAVSRDAAAMMLFVLGRLSCSLLFLLRRSRYLLSQKKNKEKYDKINKIKKNHLKTSTDTKKTIPSPTETRRSDHTRPWQPVHQKPCDEYVLHWYLCRNSVSRLQKMPMQLTIDFIAVYACSSFRHSYFLEFGARGCHLVLLLLLFPSSRPFLVYLLPFCLLPSLFFDWVFP